LFTAKKWTATHWQNLYVAAQNTLRYCSLLLYTENNTPGHFVQLHEDLANLLIEINIYVFYVLISLIICCKACHFEEET
jgi:hypothetical protein